MLLEVPSGRSYVRFLARLFADRSSPLVEAVLRHFQSDMVRLATAIAGALPEVPPHVVAVRTSIAFDVVLQDSADPAAQQSGELVAASGNGRAAGASGVSEFRLCRFEVLCRHEGFVDQLVGSHPFRAGIPAHAGLVAEADVIDIDEDLVFALLVPDLVAGVAGGWR